MALTECWECKAQISDSAASCPQCGAARKAAAVHIEHPPKKAVWPWVVGVPVGLLAAFLLYGASIPEYKAQALQRREICEKLAGPMQRTECERTYQREIEAGRAAAEKKKGP